MIKAAVCAGVLLWSGAALADTTIDAASFDSGNLGGCEHSEIGTQLVRTTGQADYVRLTYSLWNTCTNVRIGSGSGVVPRSAFTGSITQGRIRVSVNVATVAGYAYVGRAFSGWMEWTVTNTEYERRTAVNYRASNGVKVSETRVVNAFQSSRATGINNIVGNVSAVEARMEKNLESQL